MAKTTKPIQDNGLLSKKSTPYEMLNPNSLDMNISNETWRKRLTNTMLTWAELPDSRDVMRFCMEYKIRRERLYAWAASYPDVAEAFQDMKLMIAANRREGCMIKKLDYTTAYRGMHRLDSEEAQNDTYTSRLKTQELVAASNIIYGVPSTQPKVLTDEEFKEEVNAIV